ncbi:hypothetical protein [Novipirellula sp.]|uniref:hypothetical protein n=1 Tax=Novipirellula sp. TaxID=2795430 RepID=UPI003564DA06
MRALMSLPLKYKRTFGKRQFRFVLRAMSAVFWLGPWRALAIRFFQWRDCNPRLPQGCNSMFPEVNVASHVVALNANGFAAGPQLSQDRVDELLSICSDTTVSHYDNPHVYCAVLRELILDPFVLAVARQYLGAEPRLYQTLLYWTFPPTDEQSQESKRVEKSRFHYDVGDFKSLQLFCYLTDVDAHSGPHVVILGTHKPKSWLRMMRRFLDDRNAELRFGSRIHTVLGKCGTIFFEDTVCYHKHSYGEKPRLMLRVTFVLQRRSRTALLPEVVQCTTEELPPLVANSDVNLGRTT